MKEESSCYDISSWRETERRNEMLLKAAFTEFIYKNNSYENRDYCKW